MNKDKCEKCGRKMTAYSRRNEWGRKGKTKYRCDKCSNIQKDDTSVAEGMTCP